MSIQVLFRVVSPSGVGFLCLSNLVKVVLNQLIVEARYSGAFPSLFVIKFTASQQPNDVFINTVPSTDPSVTQVQYRVVIHSFELANKMNK
jgi:hypothetical protein